MNKVKAWFKKRFEQTPERRISNAYWLGSFQMLIWMGFLQDWEGKEAYIELIQNHWTEMHWGWWLAAWILVMALYIRNNSAFRRETLWMTIKNPNKEVDPWRHFN